MCVTYRGGDLVSFPSLVEIHKGCGSCLVSCLIHRRFIYKRLNLHIEVSLKTELEVTRHLWCEVEWRRGPTGSIEEKGTCLYTWGGATYGKQEKKKREVNEGDVTVSVRTEGVSGKLDSGKTRDSLGFALYNKVYLDTFCIGWGTKSSKKSVSLKCKWIGHFTTGRVWVLRGESCTIPTFVGFLGTHPDPVTSLLHTGVYSKISMSTETVEVTCVKGLKLVRWGVFFTTHRKIPTEGTRVILRT